MLKTPLPALVIVVIAISALVLALSISYFVSVKSVKHKQIWKRNLGTSVSSVSWVKDYEALMVTLGPAGKILILDKDGTILWTDKPGDIITSASSSPKGRYAIVGVGPYELYFYDLELGKVICKIEAGKHWIGSSRWSGSGKYIAIGCEEGYLYFYEWSGVTVELKWVKKIAKRCILSTCFHPKENKLLALGSLDEHVYLIDSDGNTLWKVKLNGDVGDVYFSPNGKYIVAITEAGLLYVLKTENGKILFKHKPSINGLESVIWIGKYIITGDLSGTVYIYIWLDNDGKAEIIYTFSAAKDGIPISYGLSFNPKYDLLAVASGDGCVYTYDLSGILREHST